MFTLSNDVSLYLRQQIAPTGGEVRLQSSLRRLDQFTPDNLTWYSQPITVQYIQPLFSYNAARWDKKIEPHMFEAAKVEYIEAMEDVTILAASYFWGLALAELNRDNAVRNHENSRRLYRIARERYNIGSMSRGEVMQLELRALWDNEEEWHIAAEPLQKQKPAQLKPKAAQPKTSSRDRNRDRARQKNSQSGQTH